MCTSQQPGSHVLLQLSATVAPAAATGAKLTSSRRHNTLGLWVDVHPCGRGVDGSDSDLIARLEGLGALGGVTGGVCLHDLAGPLNIILCRWVQLKSLFAGLCDLFNAKMADNAAECRMASSSGEGSGV
jgi:hypothetical protein